jgi:glycosyltransferase involved in cell wall biosynthesis
VPTDARPRVLFTSHTAIVGGAELFLLDLLSAGGSFFVPAVLTPQGDLAERVRALGIPVYPASGTAGSLKVGLETPRAVVALVRDGVVARRAARDFAADVVHANTIRGGLALAVVGRLPGMPRTLTHVHDTLPDGRAARLVHRIVMRGTTRTVANSSYTAARIQRDAPGPVDVVHNSVDLVRFDPTLRTRVQARVDAGLAPVGPLLGMVAQITPWKGQIDAIRALATVHRTYPEARLLIAGSTKFTDAQTRFDNRRYLAECEAEIVTLRLGDAVTFLGERDDVPALVRACDIVLMPSWEEPFGRIAVEAMASGTPVVATEVGGPAEFIVDGVDGLLVPPRDPSALGEALKTLLEDGGLRERMGAAGRVTATERFAPPVIIDALLDAWHRAESG